MKRPKLTAAQRDEREAFARAVVSRVFQRPSGAIDMYGDDLYTARELYDRRDSRLGLWRAGRSYERRLHRKHEGKR